MTNQRKSRKKSLVIEEEEVEEVEEAEDAVEEEA
jgi:hypothetical protein